MIRESLAKLVRREDLDEAEIAEVVGEIMSGQATEAQMGAFLAALASKGETFAELAGAARAMRRKALRVNFTNPVVVDTCGTGGDGAGTFNISTTAAFVVAGCGVTVAKHGNRSVSSQCGSADVLETLGVKIDLAPEVVEQGINEIGIGFLFAPLYHGALRYAANARKEIGVRSIFNMLGPLTNPAGARCQLLGVFAPQLTEMFGQALRVLGARRALVVHGQEGLDEVSVCAPTRVCELDDGRLRTYDVAPEQLLGRRADPAALKGGDPATNAEITRAVLRGEKGPQRDVVLVNTAAALIAAGAAAGFEAGIALAAQSIDGGAAQTKLDALIEFTQKNG